MDESPTLLALQALGLATGAALCAMLGVMQWHTRNRSAVSSAQGWLWLSGFIWTAATFVLYMMLLGGITMESTSARMVETFGWSATCLGPLIISRLLDGQLPRSSLQRVLLNGGTCSSLAVALMLPMAVFSLPADQAVTWWARTSFYVFLVNVSVYVVAYAVLRIHPPTSISRRTRAFLAIGVAIALAQILAMLAAIVVDGKSAALRLLTSSVSEQWVVPWAIFVGTLLAEVHYADVVLRRSLLLVLSMAIAATISSMVPGVAPGLPFVMTTLALAVLILCAPYLPLAIRWLIDRGLLRRPNYGAHGQAFADTCRRLVNSREVLAQAASCIEGAVRMKARFVAQDGLDRSIPTRWTIREPGGISHKLELTATSAARSLMQDEMRFIDYVMTEVSHRLESLAHEQERRELHLREERLRRSLTEAELKALRSQVDPHFLFNALNTIADLIERSPAQAEVMTERLAECFRYTLTRQEKALSTLDEEVQFVRQYLGIEQARFGERLRVEIAGVDAVGEHMVPTLILQPLVENAVRHGLGPKAAGGKVSLLASREGDNLLLEIDDDGVGMQHAGSPGHGIGLSNVRQRLQALYRGGAQLSVGPGRTGDGTCITLRVPVHAS